jgi:transcriptional regulator with XRE-family HTH domain
LSEHNLEDEGQVDREYALEVGKKLRVIRKQQRLSLQGVEQKSGGKLKAVVVGSYERGDRAVSVARLAELAEFYGVPVSEFLPDGRAAGAAVQSGENRRIVLDLGRLRDLSAEQSEPMGRFVATIQRERGDYGNEVLSLRSDDLKTLAILYNETPERLLELLIEWGVVR